MARIILLKCALLAFGGKGMTLGRKLYLLIEFLHEKVARLPQFEVLVAYRFFELNAREPFFNVVQQNARDLDKKIKAMSWDLAHWRALFDMLLIDSSLGTNAAFPIPHFLTFDHPFVKLTDGMHIDGLIYSRNPFRYDQLPNRKLSEAISELLVRDCLLFYQPNAKDDRARRAQNGPKLAEHLAALETQLVHELEIAQSQNAVT